MNINELAEAQDFECAECGMPLEDRDAFISVQGDNEFAICVPCAELEIRLRAGQLIADAETLLGIEEVHTMQFGDN
jgi:hypothetical protein